MGGKLPPLTLREVIAVLEHNGFIRLPLKATSHRRYRGMIGGKTVLCDVDAGHQEFIPKNRTAFYYLVTSQLGIALSTFYAGHPSTARRAQLKYARFGDC